MPKLTLVCSHVYLLVDHVTHGHSDLHACPLNVVEVEVMEHCQADGADGQASCISKRLVKRPLIGLPNNLEIPNHLPQENRLDNFNDLLLATAGGEEE